MSEPNNTLNLDSLRRAGSGSNPDPDTIGTYELPKSSGPIDITPPVPERPANRPAEADIVRQRLQTIPSPHTVIHGDRLPAAPTAKLITNKHQLAQRPDLAPQTTHMHLPGFVIPLATALTVFLLVLIIFKAPVFVSQVSYALSGPVASPTPAASAKVPAENTVSIPKIGVHAPVQYISATAEAEFQRALETGVVHYATTSLPGQFGNVAIFGHSSNDWWEPGDYKFVFVLLDRLVPGDKMTVDYQSRRYTYEVTGSKIVEPNAIEVLAPTAEPTLTLITCTPAGTSLRRLVISAKQIDPKPVTTVVVASPTPTPAAADTELPSGSKNGFWSTVKNGVGEFWNNLFPESD